MFLAALTNIIILLNIIETNNKWNRIYLCRSRTRSLRSPSSQYGERNN